MTIAHEDRVEKEKNARRLLALIVSRLVIITLFLGITIIIDIKQQTFRISQITINSFYWIAASVYLFSVVYIYLFRVRRYFRVSIYLQITVDIIAITFLIFMFGSTQIDYSLFYTLIIIYSVIFLGKRGGMFVASISSILFGLYLNLEFYKLMPSFSMVKYEYDLNSADVLTNLMVRITSFYVLAFLVSFIVEKEKQMSSLLQEKESEFNQLDLLFRSIVESVHSGVMTLDLNNVIKTFNTAAEEITGFSRSRMMGRRMDQIFPEFMPLLKDKLFDKQNKARIEIVIKGKKGDKINLGLSFSPLIGKNNKIIGNILIFQNITQIKQMEMALEKSRNMALIGEMAAGWAHEVKNPLAAITGSIELLKQGLELEGTNKRLMNIILRGKDQLESFAHDFLLLARSVPVSREFIDINKVIDDVLEHIIKFNQEWTGKIRVRKNLANGVKIYANKDQIWQIINNLILNALQAMDEDGSMSIKTDVRQLEDGKKYVEIIIADTGCGIKEEDLSKIFEPFFTKKDKGIGLGLAIVSHIVDGYKGKIKVESAAGKGTTFRIWLPVEREETI